MKSFREKHSHGDRLFPFEFFDQSGEVNEQVCFLHWHDEIEWLYVCEGKINIFVDGISHIINAGEMYALEPHILHYMIAIEKSRYLTCVFDRHLLEFALADYVSCQYINPFIEGKLTIKNPVTCSDLRIQNTFFNILNEYKNQQISSQLSIKLNLLYIFQDLIENNYLIPLEQNKHNLLAVEKVLQYIEKNYQEKITSQSLAQLVNYNHQYFSRYFKENTGYTPIEYINHYRIEKACELLFDMDLSILSISVECGFDSCSYFIKKFKEIKSMSPKQYRKVLLENYEKEQRYLMSKSVKKS